MAKSPKSNSTRKPPTPADGHADIAEWIRHVMPDLRPLVEYLDKRIRDTIPGLQYAVKWKRAYYGLPGKGWLIELVAYDVSINLVFFGGAAFDSPPPLGEGSRYVKIRTLEEARQPEMLEWIRQAAKVPGWQ